MDVVNLGQVSSDLLDSFTRELTQPTLVGLIYGDDLVDLRLILLLLVLGIRAHLSPLDLLLLHIPDEVLPVAVLLRGVSLCRPLEGVEVVTVATLEQQLS